MTDTHANPATIKVAVATKGLGQVDLHFGHADDFHIYEAGPGGIHYIEKRLVAHYCQGGFGDEDKREVIIRALADCAGLLVAKVGDGPKKRLLDAGIEAVDDYAYGATEDSIKTWYQKRLALNAG
jgi:nitrogen fixation protein NifB